MAAFLPPATLRLPSKATSRPPRRIRPPTFCTSSSYSHAAPNGTYTETTPPSYETQTRPVPASDLKCELYALASTTNRGFSATPSQREQVLSLIAELERTSPSSDPVDSAVLPGKWRLLFTDALDVLSLGLLSPVALVGNIYQNIFEVPPEENRPYEFELENVVELQPAFASVANAFLGESVTEIRVKARGKRESEKRIDITFVDTAIKPVKVVGVDVPVELPPLRFDLLSPVGFIDTTVLDDDVRVARSPPNTGRSQGNVFVLVREQ